MTLLLITNDDGADSIGLRELVRSLIPLGEILVVAPSTQKSGQGKAVTYYHPVRLHEEERYSQYENVKSFCVDGTPADCVIVGRYLCQERYNREPDLVISGINAGDNTSIHAIFTSGTCAAAIEGGILGICSIAFSLELPKNELFDKTFNSTDLFQLAATHAKDIVIRVLNDPLPENIKILNVNFPNSLTSKTESRIVGLCPVKYVDEAIPALDPRGVEVFWFWGKTKAELPSDTDSYVLLKEKKISISPISLNLGDAYLENLREYFSED
jgi:5'-nucleotidase